MANSSPKHFGSEGRSEYTTIDLKDLTPSGQSTPSEKSHPDGPVALPKTIRSIQIYVMAASSSIGAGILVSSGHSIVSGGPGSTVLGYSIVGCMVVLVISALGEMATSMQCAGSFYDFGTRFVGNAWGFAIGVNYAINNLVVLPFELTAIASQMRVWTAVNPAVFIGPFLVFIALVAMLGSRWFAWLEFGLGVGKSYALFVFVAFASWIAGRGIPGDPRGAVGLRYWSQDTAFLNGVQGFIPAFQVASLSFAGAESLGLVVAEARSPRTVMRTSMWLVVARIFFLVVLPLVLLGTVVPADSPELRHAGEGASMSPFMLAATVAGVPAMAHFFGLMIVISLLSMANIAIFSSARILKSLGDSLGVTVLGKVKWGVPITSIGVAFAAACLAFVNAAPGGETVFDWLMSILGMGNVWTWLSIFASHIRFRGALAAQGRDPSELIFRGWFGVWGSYLGAGICIGGAVAQVIAAFWPLNGAYSATTAARELIGIPFFLVLLGGYCVYERLALKEKRFFVPLEEADLVTEWRSRNDSNSRRQE